MRFGTARAVYLCLWAPHFFDFLVDAKVTPPSSQSASLTEDWHYGDHSAETKPYLVEFVPDPVVRSPEHSGHHRKDRRTLNYVRYLQTEQDRVLARILSSNPKVLARYHYAYNGATVMLTDDEADALRNQDDVLHVWEESFDQQLLRTTQVGDVAYGASAASLSVQGTTPLTIRGEEWINSLGMTGEGIVMGIIDSGIYPENESFLDDGTYGPPPTTFSGTGCAFGNTDYNPQDAPFTCNNKLLAAKCYAISESSKADTSEICGGDGSRLRFSDHFLSARDDANSGHGSHVASTAAGNANVSAVIDGEVVGIISGVAPRARISAYKVCWLGSCGLSNTLAGIDAAVADGVDVINYSIGGNFRNPPIEKAFLNVMNAGVVAVAAAGNSGPNPASVGQPAALPWLLAVAASGNPQESQPVLEVTAPSEIAGNYEFVQARNGPPVTTENAHLFSNDLVLAEPLMGCSPFTNAAEMQGKVALISRGDCLFTEKIENAANAGAVACIIYNNNPGSITTIVDESVTIPCVSTSQDNGILLSNALQSGQTPVMGVSFASTANVVAEFSSRGPNGLFSPSIIKPDIIAPGQQILAASTPYAAGVPDSGRDDFGYLQGTSMASPHIAGMVALIKQAYPNLSPSAIKSIIMTTARQDMVNQLIPGLPASALSIGSGFPQLEYALHPSLVYDMDISHHQAAYCGIAPSELGNNVCNGLAAAGYSFNAYDMNYPSIAAANVPGSLTTYRTVTNVASATLRFRAVLDAPISSFEVEVTPCEFVLAPGESLSFQISITASPAVITGSWQYGSLVWMGEGYDASTPLPGTSSCSSSNSAQGPPNRKRYLRTLKEKKVKAGDQPPPLAVPSSSPSSTTAPSSRPSTNPSAAPSSTKAPSIQPSAFPSAVPSIWPSSLPSTTPSLSMAPSPDDFSDESILTNYTIYSPIAVTFA